jgi:hypothetical protein
MLSMRDVGRPPIRQVKLPTSVRCGPIIMPDNTPIPASPSLSVPVVPMLCTGMQSIRMFIAVVGGSAITLSAMFGNGIGIGPTGVGIAQTSGKPRLKLGICVVTNILLPHVDTFAIQLEFFFSRDDRVFPAHGQHILDVVEQLTGLELIQLLDPAETVL